MTEPIAIVAIITAVGSLSAIVFKYVRHSECLGGCCEFDTRSPTNTTSPNNVLSNPPSPINQHKNNKNNTDDNIKEIEV
jgi:hypothetical protein